MLFLFFLGTGLSSLASSGRPAGADFKTFIYRGRESMSVLFTAIFSAASIVGDREFGFLREMLAAPVSRSAIVIGKCLGGATVCTFQGIVILAMMAARITQIQAFMTLTQMLVLRRVTWDGWAVPVGISLGIVAVTGTALLGMAIVELQRTE